MRAGLLALLLAAATVGGAQDVDHPRIRVLFIGNSLTAANDLPGMVQALAAQAGLRNDLVCDVVAKPNYSLEDQWSDADTTRALRSARWTHIVLQQGPSSLADSRAALRASTKKFAAEARGAKVLLYGVWPPRDRLAFQKDVTESYRLAAADAAGELVAVGEGWRLAWERDPLLPLYGPDGFHPSPTGTFIGALMFFEKLTGRSPSGLKPPRSVNVDAGRLTILHAAARDALSLHPKGQ